VSLLLVHDTNLYSQKGKAIKTSLLKRELFAETSLLKRELFAETSLFKRELFTMEVPINQ